jgi:hypothetical protein
VLENQLFAQAIKGVIDFGFAWLARFRVRGKRRTEAELGEAKIDKSMLLIPDSHIYLYPFFR